MNVKFEFSDGFVNTKKAAITAVGALAEHTEQAYYPFLQQTLATFLTNETGTLYSYHKSIRAETISVFSSLLQCAVTQFGIATEPAKGQLVTLPDEVDTLCRTLIVACVHTIAIDGEKLPVAQSMEQISEMLNLIGARAVVGTADGKSIVDQLMERILICLQVKRWRGFVCER